MDNKGSLFIALIVIGIILLSFIKCEIARQCSSENDDYFTVDEVYHIYGCPLINEYNVEECFESKQEAEEAGYKPCRWCIK